MTYIHGKLTTDDKMHLDLKPENVLLARDGDTWTAKVADFGAQVDGEGGDDQSGQHSDSAPRRKVTVDPNAISPIGTWEYMAPECWKRKLGEPGFASDVFSFGMMLWEMVARVRVYTAFPGIDDMVDKKHLEETGETRADVSIVAARLASGQRPEAPPRCPVLLFKLM
eukprot:COSAG04_NODE_16260_length_505_cov_0.761084_1_plen_167_part_11